MSEQIDITKANLNILLEIDGEVYVVARGKLSQRQVWLEKNFGRGLSCKS